MIAIRRRQIKVWRTEISFHLIIVLTYHPELILTHEKQQNFREKNVKTTNAWRQPIQKQEKKVSIYSF